jgi:rhodanese-related sulfurtransferase
MTFDFFSSGSHKISPAAFLKTNGAVFLDVRSPEETGVANFPFLGLVATLNIPTESIPDRLDEIPKDKLVGVFCSGVTRSSIVYAYLRTKGYQNVRIIEGGYVPLVEELRPGKLLKHLRTRGS